MGWGTSTGERIGALVSAGIRTTVAKNATAGLSPCFTHLLVAAGDDSRALLLSSSADCVLIVDLRVTNLPLGADDGSAALSLSRCSVIFCRAGRQGMGVSRRRGCCLFVWLVFFFSLSLSLFVRVRYLDVFLDKLHPRLDGLSPASSARGHGHCPDAGPVVKVFHLFSLQSHCTTFHHPSRHASTPLLSSPYPTPPHPTCSTDSLRIPKACSASSASSMPKKPSSRRFTPEMMIVYSRRVSSTIRDITYVRMPGPASSAGTLRGSMREYSRRCSSDSAGRIS